jgi:predicted Zn finger-like uncharacterized protein
MRLACPSCAAEYEVPASRLKPNKLVRCARCANSWLPDLDAGSSVSPADTSEHLASDVEHGTMASPSGMTAMDRLAAPRTPQPARRSLIAAWVLTCVVLSAGVAATIGWRDSIVRAWPPSGRILGAASGPTRSDPAQTTGHIPSEPAQTNGKAAE